MTPRRAAIGCVVSLALVAGAVLAIVRPSIWEYERAGERQVRRHRLTDRLEIRTDGRWVAPPEPRDVNAAPTAADLAAVKVREFAWTPGGLLAGSVYNASDRPIAGRVAFKIVIREKGGAQVKDRSLRKWVAWPPRRASDFVLKTGLTTPSGDRRTLVTIESMY